MKVTADFDGGSTISEGGLVLLRAAERRLGLAGCIRDWRVPRGGADHASRVGVARATRVRRSRSSLQAESESDADRETHLGVGEFRVGNRADSRRRLPGGGMFPRTGIDQSAPHLGVSGGSADELDG